MRRAPAPGSPCLAGATAGVLGAPSLRRNETNGECSTCGEASVRLHMYVQMIHSRNVMTYAWNISRDTTDTAQSRKSLQASTSDHIILHTIRPQTITTLPASADPRLWPPACLPLSSSGISLRCLFRERGSYSMAPWAHAPHTATAATITTAAFLKRLYQAPVANRIALAHVRLPPLCQAPPASAPVAMKHGCHPHKPHRCLPALSREMGTQECRRTRREHPRAATRALMLLGSGSCHMALPPSPWPHISATNPRGACLH